MADLLAVPLDGGGHVTIRPATEPAVVGSGPLRTGTVPAGRASGELADHVIKMERTLESALAPITRASQAVLGQLSTVRPHAIEIEFGVELTAEAGAVIAKAGGACHFNVKVSWQRGDDPDPESR